MAGRPPPHGQKFSSQPKLARSDNAAGRKTVPTPARAKVGRSNGASASAPRRTAFCAVNLTRSAPSTKAPDEIAVAAPGLVIPEPVAWVPITAAPAQRPGARRLSERAVVQ